MLGRRWVVELAGESLNHLSVEHRELATLIEGAGGKRLLVFRDNMNAYKVASATGSRVRLGLLVPRSEGGVPLGEGHCLVLEPLPKDGPLMA